MNFLDTYGIAGPSDVPENQSEHTLNEEVSEVMGHIGRFWGGFRKQSQTVLQTARKDLSEVVTQAQKELTKLTSETAPATTSTAVRSGSVEGDTPAPGGPVPPSTEDSTQASESAEEGDPIASTSSNPPTLFSRLQSALPPNILETARSQLPESLKHASENIDLPQLRTTLLSEFQRVQGVTRAQAEEYVHKSETMLREAVKEAGEVLRDAVKIVPPEEQNGGVSSLVWDGADMWSLPLEPHDTTASNKPHTPEASKGRNNDAQLAVATRAESLLRRLQQDPEIIRHDPSADADSGERYTAWIHSEFDEKDADINGDKWALRISTVLNEAGSGETLQSTRDTLVPSELAETDFWKRYFFRVHQIEDEEEKRKALIEGTLEEEDFSWEDDEEEATSTSAATLPHQAPVSDPVLVGDKLAQVTEGSRNPSNTSLLTAASAARESSEEGYDVVSAGTLSPNPKPDIKLEKAKEDSDDPDSDWE